MKKINLIFIFFSLYVMAQTETQQYKVLKLIDNIEIREYPPVMKVKSTSKTNNGFGKLFKYISGDNESGTKISMTSPVYMDKENENYIMEFVLPKKFNETNSPKALKENIDVYLEKKIICATISYGGYTNKQKEIYYSEKLISKLQENKIKHNGKSKVLVYNSPYKIFNRKNEILIELDSFE
tara:strand:- start:1711 stop:2256 length:546 start_codon:yes stop_codon:yes gene_type:complete